jgi:hypothetical protein
MEAGVMSDKDREAFEAWAKSEGYLPKKVTRPYYGYVYVAESTHYAWKGWQAARDHYAPKKTIDEIAREVTEECRAEMKARERVKSSRFAVGSDLHLMEMLLRQVDNLQAAFMEMQPKLTEKEALKAAKSSWNNRSHDGDEEIIKVLRAAGVRFKEEA